MDRGKLQKRGDACLSRGAYKEREEDPRYGIHVHREDQHGASDGGGVGQQNGARRDRQRRQVQIILRIGQNLVPLQHRYDSGDAHRQGDEQVFVG